MLKLLFHRSDLRKELPGGMMKFVHLERNPCSGIDFGREVALPQVGVSSLLQKHAKSWYRYAVRRVLRSQNKLRCNKLADVLLEDKL